ncbi:MAG: hypothetical protein LQ340_002903 [Diploschistes diacapsis]|nr:MAG: hypothetical protein LQ340_002903 [Diploschistes diacapsis]
MALASPAVMPAPAAPAKPSLPLLKTPTSPGPVLPSELPRSPHPEQGASVFKVEADMRTPITPPSAYTDFLKALSPAVSTPCTATSMKSSFSFTDKTGHLTPITQPSSAASFRSCDSETTTNKRPDLATAQSAPLLPPSPFVRPTLSRSSSTSSKAPATLRRLRIPSSPYSSISESPRSAICRSATSRSATPRSAMLRSPYSPTSWVIEGKTRYFPDPPKSGCPRAVSVKQVVTRTVTYTRTPLEPAPRGKRRKIEE